MAEIIDEILAKTLNNLGLTTKIKEKRVLDLWSQIIGDKIAEHTQAKYINQGILFVAVDSPVWAHQLLFMKSNLTKKINKKLSEKLVEDIRFQCSKINKKKLIESREEEVNYDKIELEEEEIKSLVDLSSSIHNVELREKFLAVVKKDLKIKKWKKENNWRVCASCQTLIPPEEEQCIVCQLKEKNNTLNKNEISKLLFQNPWLDYKEVQQIHPLIVQEDFELIKNNLIIKMEKELDELISKALKKDITKEELKVFIQKYVMLETGVHPQNLNKRLIKRIIGENYMKVYNSV